MVLPVRWLVLVGLYGLFAPIHVFELPKIVDRYIRVTYAHATIISLTSVDQQCVLGRWVSDTDLHSVRDT
jgi:hypothetical protein